MTFRSSLSLVFLMLAFLPGPSMVGGQDLNIPSNLTLENAMRLAVDRNPTLAAAQNEILAAEGDRIAAGKRPNPVFSLQFEDFPLTASPGPFFDIQEITSRVDYEIERGGRRQLRTQAATQALEARKHIYADEVRRMLLRVQEAYCRIILATSNLETSESILGQVKRTIEVNKVRLKEGDISALDLNRIEVETLKFQDDVFQADLAVRNAKSSLLALLNAGDLSQDLDIAGTLAFDYQNSESGPPPGAPLRDLIETALKQRPDLAAYLEAEKRADTEIRLQRAYRSPNISVGAGYKRNLADNAVVFGLTIPIKVFNRNEGEILRAEAEQKRTGNLLSALRKDIQLEVQKALNAVEVNRRRVEFIRTQQLRRAEETSLVTLQSYNLGGATLIDYLDAQRTYRDALRIFNQALFDERVSMYELASSVAQGVQ